jgi:hypothetical protein
VTRVALRDIDTLWQRPTVITDIRSIEAFLFHWDFSKSSAEKCDELAKLVMSFLVGYMLVVFAFSFRFDFGYFTQVSLVVVGITKVFAVNWINFVPQGGSGCVDQRPHPDGSLCLLAAQTPPHAQPDIPGDTCYHPRSHFLVPWMVRSSVLSNL